MASSRSVYAPTDGYTYPLSLTLYPRPRAASPTPPTHVTPNQTPWPPHPSPPHPPNPSKSKSTSTSTSTFFTSPTHIYTTALLLRLTLLLYGIYQDTTSALKYTDIDYLVFTDASHYTRQGLSPYARDTYRYTPLLAWLLLPTSLTIPSSPLLTTLLFSSGKILFLLSDLLAGWLITKSLVQAYGMDAPRARKYAAGWLLNPMVANISTRGSSEGVLCVLVVGMVWAALGRRVWLAGAVLGVSVHLKIYPFVYGVAIVWWLGGSGSRTPILSFITKDRIILTLSSLFTFAALNALMYALYSTPFLQHTFLHHLTRIDHRHNFSPYSTLLYLSAAGDSSASSSSSSSFAFESLAFIPQLLLSVVVLPLALAKKSLPGAMLAQTFAFVAFNKVVTSQYFLWYLIFLPFYLPLPTCSLRQKPKTTGAAVAVLWVLGQALWLHQAYNLEFLGLSTFVPGLFLSSLGFFAVNVWILGVVVGDLVALPSSSSSW
ncbi:hypothetical protein BO70DRAFT_388400 [Aspergillus heteromorphus CBS 117.55]|uniref:GPI mannosyltransferase 1 n=1 Tax=Aspergillus heteromorphus CBS 117.55 TaxID=1448321 RepID=A0A317VTV9_9EURO|nr:uncharacterized protein BO70DRAFT_388400 [Aspergillus heteromorphus CBS 117.55]PWY77019.1 hypothetical protein BO70DRAFT_388400 [Aspergillus heteromorphus CBS 117.55]